MTDAESDEIKKEFVDMAKIDEQKEEPTSKGGYRYAYTKEELQEERRVAWDFIKSVGKSVLEGKNLVHITLPVRIFEPRSFLERLVDNWFHAPVFLSRAAAASAPLERFKQTICFAVSGLHHNVAPKKPFNPILGETYQASFADGTRIFCEQGSHHPPVSHWEVFGPDDSYAFTGYGMWEASFCGNTVKGKQTGPNVLRFRDGTRIGYNLPGLVVGGVMFGERYLNYQGTMQFIDYTNRLGCEIVFDPDKKGWLKGMFSRAPTTPSDTVRGEIYTLPHGESVPELEVDDDEVVEEEVVSPDSSPAKKEKAKKKRDVICTLNGSWLTHLEFQDTDGQKKPYWNVKDCEVFRPIPHPAPLPSDCKFRADLLALAAGDLDLAQAKKEELENLQRAEAKLRKGRLH